MVQMSAKDQLVVKALPGNSACCDCGMKNPQWASVSFGNVFCLECSGVHRYVHTKKEAANESSVAPVGPTHSSLAHSLLSLLLLLLLLLALCAFCVVGRSGCTLALSGASPWTAGPTRSSTS
jgi:Putative GTPase activating protein for Arf